MTGFRTWRRGVSLRKESTIACRTIVASNNERAFTVPAMALSPHFPAIILHRSPRPAGPQPRDGLRLALLLISSPRPAGPQPRDGLRLALLLISSPRPAGPQPRDGLRLALLLISSPRPAGPQPRDGLRLALLLISSPRPAGPQPRDGLRLALPCEMLDDRPERQRWNERQRADEEHDADQQPYEERRVRRQGAGADRHDLLARQGTGDRQHRHGQPVAAEEHAEAKRRGVEGR